MNQKYYNANRSKLEQKPRDLGEYFEAILPTINKVAGTFVELGVYKAVTAKLFIKLMGNKKITERDIWLYDSFIGLPEPTKEDKSIRNAKKGEMTVDINVALSLKKLTRKKVNVVRGYFQDTLPQTYTDGPIAVLHLDCDLYDSYKTGLEALYDKVVSGGIIMFDEYKNGMDALHWPGASKAIDEFFADKNVEIKSFKLSSVDLKKYYIYKP